MSIALRFGETLVVPFRVDTMGWEASEAVFVGYAAAQMQQEVGLSQTELLTQEHWLVSYL